MLWERPVFALCTARIRIPEVLESVKAFVQEAHARGYAVIVFNSVLEHGNAGANDTSCYSVYDLIPVQHVDMIVLMNDTIGNDIVSDTLAAFAKQNRIPLMVYDGVMQGVPSVYSHAHRAFDSLLEHVLSDHKCRRVNLLTGSCGDYGSECLVMAYSEAMRRHGLPFEQERVGYGDYLEKPAAEAAERFLRKDTPEAIVCANDEMAIAVCAVLQKHGLRVPEDVIVTSSDGIVKERFHSPRLTTCVKDYGRLSALALDTAELILDGEDVSPEIELPPLLRISESCGCCVTEQRDQNKAIQDLYRKLQICMEQESKEHSILGKMLERRHPTVIDYLDVMAKHIPEDSWLCLRDALSVEMSDESLRQFDDAAELMSTVTFRRGEKEFAIVPRAMLIPDLEDVLESGRAVYLSAVNMQNEVYGYYAYCGIDLENVCFRLPKLIHTVGNVIGSSFTTSRLQSMNEQLMAARIRDSLTGLRNRQGVMKVLQERLKQQRYENERLVMIVIGLNRLRQINSIFGRDEGDQALLSLARAILDSVDGNFNTARIGGDEFLIAFFSSHVRMNTADAMISVLKKRILSYNQVSGKSYTLEIAIGRASEEVSKITSLEELLNKAVTFKDAQRVSEPGSVPKQVMSDAEIEQMERVLNENLLSYCFQPIVLAKTGQIFAYEALMRTAGGIKIPPLVLLNYAMEAKRLYEIEWLTYNNVLKYVHANREKFEGRRIFINSIPGYFLNEADYAKIREMYGDLLPQIVVEFTEQAETDGEELRMMQARCAEAHMNIAVDDYGTGYSNIANLLKYAPDYVKIDHSLISNIQDEPKKQHFVTNIIEFAHANNFMALAEGVETEEELRAVIRFGVDLIQGHVTAKPSPEPLDAIPDHMIAMLQKFSANAAAQIVQRTFVLSGEESVNLTQLDAAHYTDLFVAQPKLEIIGDFNESSSMHIKIKDDTDCHILFHNVHFNAMQQEIAPVIVIGKNSNVTLEFQGDNRMDVGGILVPETSSLSITGKGNLSIRVDAAKAFAIGNDPDFSCGSISIDLAGCLNIISNGSQCIGIGAGYGKGQKISVTGTKMFFDMSGKEGVGIGTLNGEPDIDIIGCEATFTMLIANSVAVGAMEGAPKILCNTASINLSGSGNAICGVGSKTGGGDITLKDSSVNAEVTGKQLLIIGSGDTAPRISLRQCSVGVTAEGTSVTDIGSVDGDADLTIIDSDLKIIMRSAKSQHLAANPGHFIHTGGTDDVRINI